MMHDKKEKLLLYGNLQKLVCHIVDTDKKENEIHALPSRLSEISSYSKSVRELIYRIASRRAGDLTLKEYDELLGELVNLKIELYDELADWIKITKKPLQIMIDAVEKRLNELESKGSVAARSPRADRS
jgi:hypothetical protein